MAPKRLLALALVLLFGFSGFALRNTGSGVSPDSAKDFCEEVTGACPELLPLPGGSFQMGDLSGKNAQFETPAHTVNIKPFSMGKYPVTGAQWSACVQDGGCPNSGATVHASNAPVWNVQQDDALKYLTWLSKKAGHVYRLPSEAEYEYATRAGTTTEYWWGDAPDPSKANFNSTALTPVDAFPANPFGLYDMVGNIFEWMADCFHSSYEGAPADGSAWTKDCQHYAVLRGGWHEDAETQWGRSSARDNGYFAVGRALYYAGLRVASDSPPPYSAKTQVTSQVRLNECPDLVGTYNFLGDWANQSQGHGNGAQLVFFLNQDDAYYVTTKRYPASATHVVVSTESPGLLNVRVMDHDQLVLERRVSFECRGGTLHPLIGSGDVSLSAAPDGRLVWSSHSQTDRFTRLSSSDISRLEQSNGQARKAE